MRVIAFAVLISLCACGPCQVEVRTAASAPAESALQVTNNLSQSVNVYVTYNGSDQFVQQVRATTSLRLPVRGIPAGSTVSLKAVTVDGTHTYTRQNIILSGTYILTVP